MMWTRPRRRCRRVTSLTTFTLGPVESRLRSCWLSRRVGSSGACAPRYTAETGMRVAANGRPLRIRRTHGARVDDRVQQDREALERRRRDVEAVGVPAPGGKYERAREIDETVVDDVGPEVEDQRVLARRADEVVRDVRAALPAHREREAEVGREPADDPVRQREVVGVHDEVDVLAEVLRPALVVAEHGVADALLVVGGEQRAEEAARERAVPAGEGVGAGGGRHARWRHRILLTASTTSWRF